MPRSSVLWRSGSFRFRGRRFSAFRLFRLLSFFVSFSWQAEQQAHQETIAEHGEMMEKHQVQGWRVLLRFLFQSTLNLLLFFVWRGFCYSLFFVVFRYFSLFLLLNSFCRMRWCPISFGWRSSWRWPATSQLLPFFRLPRAQYSSAEDEDLDCKSRAKLYGEVSMRSLRSKDARILGDMEDGWTWWTEWQVTWKTHTHTHQVSSHAAALWDQPVREPPAADNPEVLLSSFWLQRNGFSFAHFLHFFEVAVMISNIFVCSWMRFPYSDWPGWTRREIAMLRMCTSFGARQ